MGTNFYKQASINQNLTFDKIYPNKKTLIEQANKDGIFPKRLVIINYYNENGYIENANIDKEAFQGVTYDSTVWQKQNDGTYLQIADLDSMTIEIDPTLTFPDNEKCVLVGVGSEQEGKPVILDKNSFLDLVESNDKKNFVLQHESDFNDQTIPISTANKLNFRDFSIEKAHVINSKSLSLQAEDDIVLNSTNTNDYTISHKNSAINNAHTINNLFDVTNKKIFIDEPSFDIHGHLESKGSKSFSFSIIGDEDIILSNYADNEITLNHKEATFSTTAIAPTWEEKSLYIPQLTFDKWGHINLNTNNFLQIKFQSDGTYITNENLTYGIKFNHKAYEEGNSLASITADMNTGVFTFKIPNVKRDSGGHISDLNALETSIQVDNDILKLQTVNGKYEIYHNYSGHDSEVTSPATGINVIYLPILEFDDKGHIIQTDANDLMISLDTEDLQLIESSMNPNSFTIAHKDYETINDIDTIISKKIKTSENDAYNPSRSDFIDISQEPQYEDLRYSFYSVLDLQSSFTANSSITGNSAGEIITIFDSKGNVLKTWTYTANDGLIIEKTISIHYVHTDPNELLTLSLRSVGEGTRYGISIINNATNFRVYTTPKRSVIKTPVINFNKTGHFKDHEEQEFVTLEFDYNQFSIASIEDSKIIISLSQTLLDRIGQLEARIAELENK